MAFGAFGFFPSHMTGNASQISTEVPGAEYHDLLFLAVLITAFIVGSTTARLLVITGLKRNLRTIFCLILLAEGVILTLTSLFETVFYSSKNNGEVLVLLGFLMGIHNSTSTQLSNGRVRSTHVTGTLTDAGIAFGSYLSSFVSAVKAGERHFYQKQLHTHLTTIASFLTGCIAGFLLFSSFGFRAMIPLGLVLVLVALSTIAMTLHTTKARKII